MDTTGERHRGLLTAHDLSTWHARLEAPASRDYHGLTVAKTGPWGQGPVFLQQLALLGAPASRPWDRGRPTSSTR